MGPDEHRSQSTAADLEALRLRVDRLEREIAELRRGTAVVVVTPPPLVSANVVAVAVDPPPPPKPSLENRLGSQVFNRIGIVALLIGTTWFLKLAIDNHWIGPLGRILIGLIAGAGIILWSERFRRQGVTAFSYSLKAVGSGALYLSLWAAFQLYHLLPAPVALGAMVLVTAWNAYMAWSQDAELLAAYALIGGFATPLLLSTGGNHELFLFSYLLAIDVATVLLIRLKGWPRLLVGIFPATVAYFIGWYGQFYSADELGVTSLFLVLFWFSFLSSSIAVATRQMRPEASRQSSLVIYLSDILLPLGNAAFLSLGLYSVLQDSHRHADLPWLMVILAAAYLGIMRLPQSRLVSAIHLSLAVVFLTIAVPLKASGHWITVAWLIEGVALLWVSSYIAAAGDRSRDSTEIDGFTETVVLRWLSTASLLLGFVALLTVDYWFGHSVQKAFFNHNFASALIGVAAFAAAAWLAYREHRRVAKPEVTSLRTWVQFAGAFIIALNIVAIFAFVREIDALWIYSVKNPSASLKQALAVSAFLMVYSAMLLAVGFWKRTAFVRWQGLILLVFTIAKTFLYDMSSLSQGYRVVSFLGLGVLLMAVSFAYQKDWLGLRELPSVDEAAK
jgi:uncharacterized membrane protein